MPDMEEIEVNVDDIIDEADEIVDVLEDLGIVEDGKYDNLVALLQRHRRYVIAGVLLVVTLYYAYI
jgi:hypothetical protein